MYVNGNVNIPFVGQRLPSICLLWDKLRVCQSLSQNHSERQSEIILETDIYKKRKV
jgi:hypothetical protein